MRKTILFSVLVLMVFALAVFTPNAISAAAPTQYKIVSVRSSAAETLGDLVSAELNAGWSPIGGPFYNGGSSGGSTVSQALIK
jgi:hypothetical protein